jgi:hypothetical protein
LFYFVVLCDAMSESALGKLKGEAKERELERKADVTRRK